MRSLAETQKTHAALRHTSGREAVDGVPQRRVRPTGNEINASNQEILSYQIGHGPIQLPILLFHISKIQILLSF